MESKEINETNVVKNINTSFQESLKSGIVLTYLFSEWEKRFWWITLDWQYRFTLYKKWNNNDEIVFWETKVFSELLWDNEDDEKTWKDIKEQALEAFEYSSIHHQLWWHWIPNKIFSLDNPEEIDEFFLELEKTETKWDINNVLDYIPSRSELQERAEVLAWSFIKTLRDWHKIDIADYRRFEPDIDLMLNIIIDEIFSFSWYKDKKSVIEHDFILDDLAKSHIRTETIEWVDFSFEELAKRMGDLFYEPLASMLNSIAIELEKQIDSNEEVIRLLKEACNHILKAWDHCKPYVTDINELEKKSKHTFDIRDTSLTNEQISRAIAYLDNNKLKEFLELLSSKLYKDWEADKWRWRIKLSNELFACSERLKQASNLV